MMETARAFGELKRSGWKPRRTLIFASWDAEEFTLTGSTEWGELEAEKLKAGALAYLNVDSSASGNNFSAAAVPALAKFLRDVARDVPDPSGGSIYDAWARNNEKKEASVTTRLGSGSDYTVFLNFLGIPIADLTFDGPYGVYHSIYDSFTWVDRVGNPGYYYHAAMARYWAVAACNWLNAITCRLTIQRMQLKCRAILMKPSVRRERRGWILTLAQRGRPLNVGRALVVQHWKRREKQLRVVIQRAWNACTKR